jgi:hypothetical protein
VMPPSDGTRSDQAVKSETQPAPPPDPGVVESFLDFIGFL